MGHSSTGKTVISLNKNRTRETRNELIHHGEIECRLLRYKNELFELNYISAIV